MKDLVAIIGTTGVGKSQLAIDLSLEISRLSQFKDGQVINSDSMQVYRGLDVITNKATIDEMQGVPHHLMNFLEPGEEYQVGTFQVDAIKKIEDLHAQNSFPIVVGGTNYYLQHLLFPNQLVSESPLAQNVTNPSTKVIQDIQDFPDHLKESILSLSEPLLQLFFTMPAIPLTSSPDCYPPNFPIALLPQEYQDPEQFSSAMYSMLSHIDPESASRWHWRDVRKVRRAIDIVWEGRQWKDVLQVQQESEDVQVRYRTLIFWLYADKDALEQRLDSRVDKMIEKGLLKEIKELYSINVDAEQSTKGIFQSIGYKEFYPYLSQLSEDPNALVLDKLLQTGVERTKLSTCQYAKRQIAWIRKKLIPAINEYQSIRQNDDVTLYLLDASDLSEWNQNVRDKAFDITKTFLRREQLPKPEEITTLAANIFSNAVCKTTAEKIKRVCKICTTDETKPFMVESWLFDSHLTSKTHKRSLKQHAKQADFERWKARTSE